MGLLANNLVTALVAGVAGIAVLGIQGFISGAILGAIVEFAVAGIRRVRGR